MANLIRDRYLEYLSKTQDTDTLKNLAKKDEYTPIYTVRTVQAEEEPDFDVVNKNIAEMYLDLNDINEKIVSAGALYGSLRSSVDARLSAIQEKLDVENERLQDMNMICGNISDFTSIKKINSSVFSGNFSYSDDGNTLFCPSSGIVNTGYTILDVSGNGTKGNTYVKPVVSANVEWRDTSDERIVQDGDLTTSFEYSRYETTVESEKRDGIVHFDTEPCRCTFELFSSAPVTLLKLNTEDTDVILESIHVSNDGAHYTPAITKSIPVFKREYCYNNYQYIYGSGILSFKPSQYIRITVSSNAKSKDIILDPSDEEKKTTLPNTKRKTIRLNQISLYNANFQSADMTSTDVIQKGSLTALAVFSNIYIPNNFRKDSYITMELIVNGTAYPIVPINSNDVGIKIIRYSKNRTNIDGSYVYYIKEPITTAKLHVTLKPYNTVQTPFISNLKFCVGKTEGTDVY